jgi:hypothetical protein
MFKGILGYGSSGLAHQGNHERSRGVAQAIEGRGAAGPRSPACPGAVAVGQRGEFPAGCQSGAVDPAGDLHEKERPGAADLLEESERQRIIAMVCSDPPAGRSRWTIRLVAEEVVKRKLVPRVGRETIRILLLDHDLTPWREKNVVRANLTPNTSPGWRTCWRRRSRWFAWMQS